MINPEKSNFEKNTIEEEILDLYDFFQIETIISKNEQGEDVEQNIVKLAGVPIESYASREELEEIIRDIWPTQSNVMMLESMAVNYNLNRGLIIEGGTGMGKTYMVNKFTELVFGKRRPVDFYCNGETSTFELLSKYVPNTKEDKIKWEEILKSKEAKFLIKELEENLAGERGGKELIRETIEEIANRAGIEINASNWKFQFGALPRAMTMPEDPSRPIAEDNPSRGIILHVQEVGLAQAEIINTLLQLGGEEGQIAKKISLWENGGREIEAGPNFRIIYSTNPPESFNSRQVIDQALLRRNSYLNLGEAGKSSENIKLEQYFHRISKGKETLESLKNRRPEVYDYALKKIKDVNIINFNEQKQEGNIPIEIEDLIIDLRSDFVFLIEKMLKQGAINQDRMQKIEFTSDHSIIADAFIDKYLDLSKIEEIIDKSFELFYFNCFAGKDREKVERHYEQIKKEIEFSKKIEEELKKIKEASDDFLEQESLVVRGERILKQIDDFLQ